jgi:serine/threonine protein kinase
MADGSYFAYCRSIHPVCIYNMAPDVSVEGLFVCFVCLFVYFFLGLQSQLIPFSSFVLNDKIGEGSFSVVFKGQWNGQVVAVKRMNIADELDTNEKRKVFSEWRREVETMRSLSHGNIVAMRGICLDPICMLLDFCNSGDLYHFLVENDMFWKLRLSIAADIAAGMGILHSVTPPIVHRDLKSPNVLMHRLESGAFVAKVADFGLSVRFGLVTALKGSAVENPVWTAPEVLQGFLFFFFFFLFFFFGLWFVCCFVVCDSSCVVNKD